MDNRNLKKLEFHKIIEWLTDNTTFGLGREKAMELRPLTDINEIISRQAETTEAKNVIRREPDLPLGGLRDIRKLLHKSVIGGVLEPSELLDVANMIFAMRRLKSFFRDKGESYPILCELANRLTIYKELEEDIRRTVDENGDVLDNASVDLRRLRSTIRNIQISIKEKMDAYVRSSDYQKYLQDPIVTMRGDRYVLPVKQEYRGQIPGIIHDQSASGATLFIEPMAAVEKGNELRRLQVEERQEIIKILTRISSLVGQRHDDLMTSVVTAGEIDFIIAKGKLSHKIDGGQPKFNEDGYINFPAARHPLLKEKAVPINIWLGKKFKIIVVTGPNTGGKTVALKTVGLLILMAQSGLHIPTEAGAETSIFDEVFADIGDEQSIEQSLSTFSSHMTNVISILEKATPKSLVLFDELGAGTDPSEGAALAMAILDHLDQRNISAVATTHYSELKAFAFNRSGIENASVEFDIKTLRPTYKLNIGRPGSSSAFDISARLGLSKEIIETAKESLSAEEVQVSDLIRQLERDRTEAEKDRMEGQKLKNEIEKMKQEYTTKINDLNAKRADMLEKSRAEAHEVRRKARLEAQELIEELKKIVAKGASQQSLTEAQKVRKKLRDLGNEEEVQITPSDSETAPEALAQGQEVFIPRYNQQGVVLSDPDDNKNVQVQVGVMKLTLPISEIRVLKKNHSAAETGAPKVMAGKARDIRTEIDLRGMVVDEALEMVEKYLDDAYLAGLPKAYIIHGKGTGALRSAITKLLTKHRYVKSHRLGEYGEGGNGVTVVELV